MAAFVKLPSGSWRAVVRRKSRYISETFRRKDDARAWALDAERQIDRGGAPKASRTGKLRTFGDLVDLHAEDMNEVGRAPGRSKDATLAMLKRELGGRDRIIRFGRARAEQGAGPVTHRYRRGADEVGRHERRPADGARAIDCGPSRAGEFPHRADRNLGFLPTSQY